jgi:hypothetical protein
MTSRRELGQTVPRADEHGVRSRSKRGWAPVVALGMALAPAAPSLAAAQPALAVAQPGSHGGCRPSVAVAAGPASALRNVNELPERVDVRIAGERVLIGYDDARDQARPQNVARRETTSPSSEAEDVRISLTVRPDEGGKVRPEEGRRVWVDLTVSSDRLPAPATYRIPYRID